MKSHGLVENSPSEDDQKRGNEKGDLDARANGNTHGKVHLVANSHNNGRDVLCRVTDDGDENKTNKVLADVGGFDNGIDTFDEVIGADGDQDSGNDENDGRRNRAHDRLLNLLLVVVLSLGIEEVGVSAQLEPEVQDIEQQQNDGGTAGEDQDAVLLLGAFGLVENRIELRDIVSHEAWGFIPYRECLPWRG